MARRVVRIDLDRATMLSFGDGPVEVVTTVAKPSAVSLRRCGIEFDGLRRSLLRGGGTFRERLHAEYTEPVVIVGNAGVGESVIRIEVDSFLISLYAFARPTSV